MKAMVLAAGLGTRLKPITFEIPKPMVPVLDRPVMAHIVDLLDGQGFDELIANLHYFPDSIKNYFGDRLDVPLRGGAARHRRRRAQRARLLRRRPGRDRLRRRAHRHRPAQAGRAAPVRRAGSPRSRSSGCRTRASTGWSSTTPTAASRGSRRSPTRPRRCRTSATAASTASAREIFDYFPDRAVRGLGAGRLPGAARERRAVLRPRDRRVLERRRLAATSCERARSTRSRAS